MSDTPTPQTIAKNWYLVTVRDKNGEALADFFWGIVVEDRKNRFKPGDYVCSTLIVETLGDSLFRTQNTLYEGSGEGERVSLALRHFKWLRAGLSPPEIEALAANNLQIVGL
ncbi:hypothetical protein EHN06_21045 (plasmid) [Marinobacter sp. NP-4(2019)]|uniref:DUF6957 family protein n=1 Tax=Marinobacter sp. NP-4(2019) TaxID=2488665 RepID=UPI000FC3D117|nr:hypothetical protein [Marinobacter sp. NP-4(2019)]AZT86077.1 hypothetical protein EHN06_20890 [Marinobacter sp. NP-4(2019)]AZT86105.1 hypothetical protein EHN06_21045 [Marinobacter sp. NP-4(2019)]